jgi:uncharacterized membrane protein
MAVDVDRQRMVITPVLRLVFALTSLVDTSDYMEVAFVPFSIFYYSMFYEIFFLP